VPSKVSTRFLGTLRLEALETWCLQPESLAKNTNHASRHQW
jgi:hypothetical protein